MSALYEGALTVKEARVMPASMSLMYVIMHPMDHQNEVLTLSNGLTDTDQPTKEALCQQMRENRDNEYAQSFIFDATISDLVSAQYDAIMNAMHDQNAFIQSSQIITQHLFSTIKGNHTVKVGDLLLGLFREGTDDPWLAILKMQPAGNTYVRERLATKTPGDVAFALRVSSGALLGGLLQKSAFIAPRSLRTKDRHLVVLDQQAQLRGPNEPAARFFIDQFLGCKIDISQREMTRNLKGVLTTFAKERTKEWGTASTVVIEAMKGLEQGARLDVHKTLEELIPAQDRPQVLAALQEKRVIAPVFTVELSPGRVQQQQPNYIWLEGDNGLLLRVEKQAYEQGGVLEPWSPALGQKRFILRTTDLVPIPPPFKQG